jgi:SAM-dependent methyltransferase
MESIDEVGGAPFDLTFARRVLLYAQDPLALLRNMYRWTKPGGYIAVQDIHTRIANLYPKPAALSELLRVKVETEERSVSTRNSRSSFPSCLLRLALAYPTERIWIFQ